MEFEKVKIAKILEDGDTWFKVELEDGRQVSSKIEFIKDKKSTLVEGAEVEMNIKDNKYFNLKKEGGGGRNFQKKDWKLEKRFRSLDAAVASIGNVKEGEEVVHTSNQVIGLANKYYNWLSE